MGSSFTVFFDGAFWVGVVEVGDPDGAVRVARHVFGAEPSNAELYDFVRRRGGALIDRALSSPSQYAEPARRESGRSASPKRLARQAVREQARRGTSTAAQAALAKALEQSGASRKVAARRRREADEERRREARIQARKAKHRGH